MYGKLLANSVVKSSGSGYGERVWYEYPTIFSTLLYEYSTDTNIPRAPIRNTARCSRAILVGPGPYRYASRPSGCLHPLRNSLLERSVTFVSSSPWTATYRAPFRNFILKLPILRDTLDDSAVDPNPKTRS